MKTEPETTDVAEIFHEGDRNREIKRANDSGLRLGFVDLTPEELAQVDTDKLQALLDMKRSEEDREARRAFNRALSAFQSEVPQIHKDGTGNHQAPYAKYETIRKTIDQYLTRHGFSITFGALKINDGKATMTGTLRHGLGHEMVEAVELPVDDQLRCNNTQRGGSAASYCQRYLLRAMLGLVFTDEDDDGAAAGTKTVTDDQADSIRERVDQVEDKGQVQKFWEWLGCDKPEDVPANKFGQALKALGRIIEKQ